MIFLSDFFFRSNFQEVYSQNEDFLELPKEAVKKLIMDDNLLTDCEQDVLVAVVRWISRDRRRRGGAVANELLEHVRFGIMIKVDGRRPSVDELKLFSRHLFVWRGWIRTLTGVLDELVADPGDYDVFLTTQHEQMRPRVSR